MNKLTTLEAIYEQYFHDVYRYIYSLCRHTALTEDIVQETFYRSYDHLHSLNDTNVKPWLFRVAYNVFIDVYRKERRHLNHIQSSRIEHSRSTLDELLVKEKIQDWITVTETLNDLQKTIIQLREVHSFTYDEIAQVTGLTLSNVKVQLFRARKLIQSMMERDEEK